MSSGGGKKQTTTQTNDPPAWSVPYFQNALGMASSAANKPFQAYGGPMVAGFSDDQLASQDMIRDRATQGSGTLDAANAYTTQAINGQQNPYLTNGYTDQMVGQVTGDITNAYNNNQLPSLMGQFQSGGAFGGSAHQNAMNGSQAALGDSLARASTGIRYDQANAQRAGWETDQARRMQAAGMAPALADADYNDARQLGSIGAQQQNLWQQAINADMGEFDREQNWDADRLGLLTGALGSIRGGTSSSTGANPNYRSAGENAASYAAILASLYGGG